jgi:hypothetical protein
MKGMLENEKVLPFKVTLRDSPCTLLGKGPVWLRVKGLRQVPKTNGLTQ